MRSERSDGLAWRLYCMAPAAWRQCQSWEEMPERSRDVWRALAERYSSKPPIPPIPPHEPPEAA